jgi:hypothetical protein
MASWELFSMEMGSIGEAKTWLWWLQIRGCRCLPRVRFPPLYSFSDFRLPILGRTRSGQTRPSGLGIRRILSPEHLP